MSYYGKLNEIVDLFGINIITNYYITHTESDTAEHFNIDNSVLHRIIQKYHLKKTREQKQISINNHNPNFYAERYEKSKSTIIKNYKSSAEYGKKQGRAITNGILKKYGTKEKYAKQMTTNLNNTISTKYGVKNISQLETVKQKKKNTMIKNYGSLKNAYKERQQKTNLTLISNYGSLENYRNYQQQLAKETYIKNYGVDSPFKSIEIKKKIEKIIQDKYGVQYACMIPGINLTGSDSSFNNDFKYLLELNNISYVREFNLENYIYDFKVENTLIEINPFATHNSTFSPYGNHIGKDMYYHQNKAKAAIKNGYNIINIWDWTNKDDVINNLKNKAINKIINFTKPTKFIYDYKFNKLTDTETSTSVIIYDEGAIYEK